jgi:hypothetical protein
MGQAYFVPRFFFRNYTSFCLFWQSAILGCVGRAYSTFNNGKPRIWANREQLLEVRIRAGVPRLFDYGLRSHLRRIGTKHPKCDEYSRSHMGDGRIYRDVDFCSFENIISEQEHIQLLKFF